MVNESSWKTIQNSTCLLTDLKTCTKTPTCYLNKNTKERCCGSFILRNIDQLPFAECKIFLFSNNTQLSIPTITSCPSAEKDRILINQCVTPRSPESLKLYTYVVDTELGIFFENIHCAKCNNRLNFVRNLTFERNQPSFKTSAINNKTNMSCFFSSCEVISLPRINLSPCSPNMSHYRTYSSMIDWLCSALSITEINVSPAQQVIVQNNNVFCGLKQRSRIWQCATSIPIKWDHQISSLDGRYDYRTNEITKPCADNSTIDFKGSQLCVVQKCFDSDILIPRSYASCTSLSKDLFILFKMKKTSNILELTEYVCKHISNNLRLGLCSTESSIEIFRSGSIQKMNEYLTIRVFRFRIPVNGSTITTFINSLLTQTRIMLMIDEVIVQNIPNVFDCSDYQEGSSEFLSQTVQNASNVRTCNVNLTDCNSTEYRILESGGQSMSSLTSALRNRFNGVWTAVSNNTLIQILCPIHIKTTTAQSTNLFRVRQISLTIFASVSCLVSLLILSGQVARTKIRSRIASIGINHICTWQILYVVSFLVSSYVDIIDMTLCRGLAIFNHSSALLTLSWSLALSFFFCKNCVACPSTEMSPRFITKLDITITCLLYLCTFIYLIISCTSAFCDCMEGFKVVYDGPTFCLVSDGPVISLMISLLVPTLICLMITIGNLLTATVSFISKRHRKRCPSMEQFSTLTLSLIQNLLLELGWILVFCGKWFKNVNLSFIGEVCVHCNAVFVFIIFCVIPGESHVQSSRRHRSSEVKGPHP